MRRAARRGIRRILAETPDEGDVDDVVFKAFTEFLDKDPSDIRRSPTGFACTIADRRGRDRARSIIREREQIQGNAWQIDQRSEEHTSELQSLMRISYAVFCLKKKNQKQKKQNTQKKYNTTQRQRINRTKNTRTKHTR